MKQLMYIVCLLVTLSCGETETNTQDDLATAMTDSRRASAVKQYGAYLATLDSTRASTAQTAAEKFIETFRDENVVVRDSGFVLFNQFYEKLERGLNTIHHKDTTNYLPLVWPEGVKDTSSVSPKMKNYQSTLRQNGFQIAMAEGTTYIKQDRTFITKFYPYVSEKLKRFLDQLHIENQQGLAHDGELTITPKQYVDRIVWWEKFLRENPHFLLISEVESKYKYLLTFLLTGMPNTPVISYNTKDLSNYFQSAYNYLQDVYPESKTNSLVNPYFQFLNQHLHERAQKLLDKYRKDGTILDYSL